MTTSSSRLPSPKTVFRVVARVEAVTWGLLLIGMFLKYVTQTTDMGVRIAGMLHGVAFLAYVVVIVALWVDHRWSLARGIAGLSSAIPPFLTLYFEANTEKRGLVRDDWRLLSEDRSEQETVSERVLARILRRPWVALGLAVGTVALLTVIALLVGPPFQK